MTAVDQRLELRRQICHLVLVSALAFAVRFRVLDVLALSFLLVSGTILSLIVSSRFLPLISPLLDLLERPAERRLLPGRGVIILFLATTLLLAIFPPIIVFYALLITAIGDAVGPLLGLFYGRHKLPWNRAKHWEGLIGSIFITGLVLTPDLGLGAALISASTAMIAESVPLAVADRQLDDNLIVPFTAAITLHFLQII